METTFMTIHNLTPDANILFASESIVDVLGYQPYEVIGRSCFDYFHPDEVPFRRNQHDRSIQLDRASVLYYAQVKGRDGQWISCECVFSVVHDVLVACTSIYQQSMKSEQRAIEAPQIRRIFSSSPRDPRYHMLEQLSAKFRAAPQSSLREPRAALILNRFSRTLSVMYSTSAVFDILGIAAEDFVGKSFYECINEDCLPAAIRCLESAKANDSIAYLRFVYRDPRRTVDLERLEREASNSSDSEDGGVALDMNLNNEQGGGLHGAENETSSGDDHPMHSQSPDSALNNSRTASGGSTDYDNDSNNNTVFDQGSRRQANASSSAATSGSVIDRSRAHPTLVNRAPLIEIEAVVSCTSDGLVVILRRARPAQPTLQIPIDQRYGSGLFAAPWGAQTILPPQHQAPAVGGPQADDFMSSIREVAVFAWSVTGINGNIASYSHGTPRGEAVPPTGFPIWDPKAQNTVEGPPDNQAAHKWASFGMQQRTNEPKGGKQVPYQQLQEEMPTQERQVYEDHTMEKNGSRPTALHHFSNGATNTDYTITHNQQYNAEQPHIQYAQHAQPRSNTAHLEAPDTGRQGQAQGPSDGSNPDRYMWY